MEEIFYLGIFTVFLGKQTVIEDVEMVLALELHIKSAANSS